MSITNRIIATITIVFTLPLGYAEAHDAQFNLGMRSFWTVTPYFAEFGYRHAGVSGRVSYFTNNGTELMSGTSNYKGTVFDLAFFKDKSKKLKSSFYLSAGSADRTRGEELVESYDLVGIGGEFIFPNNLWNKELFFRYYVYYAKVENFEDHLREDRGFSLFSDPPPERSNKIIPGLAIGFIF